VISPAPPRWLERLSPHALLILIGLGMLFILAFYSVTDPLRLDHSHELTGADYVGYAICHRITDRSFTIAGRQMPLCARCTGTHLGITVTFLAMGLSGRRRWNQLPPTRVMLVLVGLIALMGLDGLNSYSHFFPNAPHLYEPRNEFRLFTGLGAGLAVGAIVFPGLAQVLWRAQVARPSLANLRELAGLAALTVLVGLLVISNRPALLYVLGLVSAAGVLMVITAVNTMILLIALKKDARYDTWKQALRPLAVGLMLAIVQVALVTYGRFALTGTMTGLPGL
jgi:uncharacterized membrane protein